MSLTVKLHPNAISFLRGLDDATQNRIKSALRNLEVDPHKSRSKTDIKKLKGTKGLQDLYRLRIGKYRVIYSIEEKTVWITEIVNREKGYRWLLREDPQQYQP